MSTIGSTRSKIANARMNCKSNLALTSVAFQDHLVKQYSLDLSLPKFNSSHSKNQTSFAKCNRCDHHAISASRSSYKQITKPKKSISKGDTTEIEYVIDGKQKPKLTLAEKLGLVDAPSLPASEYDWCQIKNKSNSRRDSHNPCPICKDNFGLHPQIILSCSHVFHKSCLQSYERFISRKVCPICRLENYEARVIFESAKLTREKAAILMQSVWRGKLARKRFRQLQNKHPPKHPTLRKKLYAEKLSDFTNKMLDQCSKRENEIINFIDTIDSNLVASRQTLKLCDAYIHSSLDSEGWVEIRDKALKREEDECSICLAPLYTAHRKLALLSCTHLFHSTCLQSFEEFSLQLVNSCPLCRETYQKVSLDITFDIPAII